ncbi:thioredoxin [Candidatus Liberibacter asiaticus]|uniref:Thioredoxin n=2 Tax=Liberibacter asiaticus TaxID=34021 RepID=C6XFZ2_LIBAP|nr:thioredoxin [Candidatus Liberibacter asiaticus]ACT57295.1 thioredoxin [Candidatus Liberibacter asiaticus str. psy62]AGH16740.1 thioredoxin [Candidatus Liberibacter asiaticus str. gxpsy]ALK07112.1 thioredoxin [Candidatus Liberibacter asiaticus]ASK52587.1 thiol reductase thioredoxin [Candidatus Liberibacter asiaticus]AWL14549.1 thioredoxin [Candidatus Liberibacter asiaticus]
MSALKVDTKSFDSEVLECSNPVVVDFWASWCRPCVKLSPIIDDIADELADKVKITKLDIEESSEISTRYQISSIPTLILFKDGKVIDRMMPGASSQSDIIEWILSRV